MTDRQTDPYAHHLEMTQKRDAWFAMKKREAEERERQQKQAQLQRYLSDRGRQWQDHTGVPASTELFEEWTREYVAERQLEAEAELEAQRAEAADQPHYHPHA